MCSNSNEEIVYVVDEINNIQSTEIRSIVRKLNLWHKGSYVLVINKKNHTICIHLRSKNKDYLPEWHSLTAGGVVTAGQTDGENAKIELAEEFGIEDVELNFITSHQYADDRIKVWGSLYYVYWEGEIKCQVSEVDDFAWIEIDKIDELLIHSNSKQFTPDTVEMYNYVKKHYKFIFE